MIKRVWTNNQSYTYKTQIMEIHIMKTYMSKIMKIIVYFFTPEDSATPIHSNSLSFHIEQDAIGIGSAKALFWVMNAMILMMIISIL